MRLADFILANLEPILAEWEAFARDTQPGGHMDPPALRNGAEAILRATAWDMKSAQTATERSAKAKGHRSAGETSAELNGASHDHALSRVDSGFGLDAVVAEYRALRASVIRLWGEGRSQPDADDLYDLTRFNESIDQSLARAVHSFTERVDRSRQMFLAILGHDLRNPVHSVGMLAHVLSRNTALDAEAAESVSHIAASAAGMSTMIVDLLDFTGAALGGKMPVSPAPMDLGAVCRDVAEEMRAADPARTLHFRPHGDLTGKWDAARLRQVVANLLGNALQHGAGARPVELTATGEGPTVVLAVHNGGPPIPPDALPTIFDPLVRGTTPELKRQRRPGSIGLGLYIAREIVVAHGGTIDVASSADSGTTFTVRLPRHALR